MLNRPVCLPVAARLVRKNTVAASRLWLAVQIVTALAKALPGRRIHVVADAAYAGKEGKKLPEQVDWTTRLRKDAALYEPAPPPTGRRGRPAKKGKKLLPKLADLARTQQRASRRRLPRCPRPTSPNADSSALQRRER
jgi:hypothetical protein